MSDDESTAAVELSGKRMNSTIKHHTGGQHLNINAKPEHGAQKHDQGVSTRNLRIVLPDYARSMVSIQRRSGYGSHAGGSSVVS